MQAILFQELFLSVSPGLWVLILFAFVLGIGAGSAGTATRLHRRGQMRGTEHAGGGRLCPLQTEGNPQQPCGLPAAVHDLITPIQSITGSVELLALHAPHADREHETLLIRGILAETRRFRDIIERIYRSLDPAYSAIHEEIINLPALLRESVKRHELIASRKGLALTVKEDSAIPPRLRVNRARFEQLLQNLLVNAIQYSDAGAVEIESTIVATTPKELRIRLCVIDTGRGMNLAEGERLFREFQRGDTSPPGIGLGLAIASQAAHEMHGGLFFTSEVAAGSTFAATMIAGVVSAQPATDLSVLVVEDNNTCAAVLTRQLRHLGARTMHAPSAKQALDLARKGPWNLVLMDLSLENGDDGRETARQIIEMQTGSPASAPRVVAVTADPSGLDEGHPFSRVLAKPVQLAELEALLAEHAHSALQNPDDHT